MVKGEFDRPIPERLQLKTSAIKQLWHQKLTEGAITYDPSNASVREVGPYSVKYLPGRLQYLRDTAPTPFTSIDIPHDPKDVFCKSWEDIQKRQLMSEVPINRFTWNLLVNNNPIEPFHSMLIPQGEPQNQLMTASYLGDLQELVAVNPDVTIGFNTFGAAASQNHFHAHLFFSDWHTREIEKMPISQGVFQLDDSVGINEYLTSLKEGNTPYNLVMTKDGVIITPRRNEHINGVKYGVDAISGRFLMTSKDQFNGISQENLENVLKIIGFENEE